MATLQIAWRRAERVSTPTGDKLTFLKPRHIWGVKEKETESESDTTEWDSKMIFKKLY